MDSSPSCQGRQREWICPLRQCLVGFYFIWQKTRKEKAGVRVSFEVPLSVKSEFTAFMTVKAMDQIYRVGGHGAKSRFKQKQIPVGAKQILCSVLAQGESRVLFLVTFLTLQQILLILFNNSPLYLPILSHLYLIFPFTLFCLWVRQDRYCLSRVHFPRQIVQTHQ